MEHHANIVPWHMLAAERGIELRWIPLTADYHLDLTDLDRLLDGAKLLAVTAMSNVLGTINDDPRRSPTPPTPPARSCSSTPASTCPHLADRRAGAGTPTSSRFTGHKMLRPDRHRRAVGPRASCSRRCRRSSAAAR